MLLDANMLRRAKPAAVLRLARWLQSRGEIAGVLPSASGHVVLTVARAVQQIAMQERLERMLDGEAGR